MNMFKMFNSAPSTKKGPDKIEKSNVLSDRARKVLTALFAFGYISVNAFNAAGQTTEKATFAPTTPEDPEDSKNKIENTLASVQNGLQRFGHTNTFRSGIPGRPDISVRFYEVGSDPVRGSLEDTDDDIIGDKVRDRSDNRNEMFDMNGDGVTDMEGDTVTTIAEDGAGNLVTFQTITENGISKVVGFIDLAGDDHKPDGIPDFVGGQEDLKDASGLNIPARKLIHGAIEDFARDQGMDNNTGINDIDEQGNSTYTPVEHMAEMNWTKVSELGPNVLMEVNPKHMEILKKLADKFNSNMERFEK